jgi:hypothetical protein
MSRSVSASLRRILLAACCGCIITTDVVAALTTVENSPDSFDEPNLFGVNPFPGNANPSILETLYGESNVMRVDDELDRFMVHSGTTASVKAIAKFVGFNNPHFGFFPNASTTFVSLFTLGGSAYSVTGSGQIDAFASGGTFATGIRFGGSIYSSNPAANPVFPSIVDRLVTYRIVGNEGHPTNSIGAYVLGWEAGATNSDNDYQDVVFEIDGVSAVPEPMSAAPLALCALILLLVRTSRRRIAYRPRHKAEQRSQFDSHGGVSESLVWRHLSR